jgi:hypothetical protein
MNRVYFTANTIESNGARYASVELSRETANAVYTWNIIRTGQEYKTFERVNFALVESLPKTRGVKELRDVIAQVEPLARELLRMEYDSAQYRAQWWKIKNLVGD